MSVFQAVLLTLNLLILNATVVYQSGQITKTERRVSDLWGRIVLTENTLDLLDEKLGQLRKDNTQAHDMIIYLRGEIDKLEAKVAAIPRKVLTN